MAKRYDPIMCMLVDEPTKAQDELKIKKEDGLWCVYKDGKVVGQSNSEAGAIRLYRMFESKAQDEILFYQLRFSSGRTEGAKLDESEIRSYAEALLEKYGEKQVAVSRQGKIVATYFNRKAHDSASALDKAIKVCDASTGHKVVVFVENYLRSIGKNNSTGKYDKIVQGVRSLLSQSLLDDEGLKKAAEHEADRLLKKYNL